MTVGWPTGVTLTTPVDTYDVRIPEDDSEDRPPPI